jgi:D-sedoheptulose 7-phosphate isomerase
MTDPFTVNFPKPTGDLMKNLVFNILKDSITTKKQFIEQHVDRILKCATLIATCLASGHKLMIFGNGGSAADSQHIAAEFVNKFGIERGALPAIALTTDSSLITSIANDRGFEAVFSRQISALGKKDDIAVAVSTSGDSTNVLNGVHTARNKGVLTIGFSGSGGKLKDIVDISLAVPSTVTARIQETHITLGHILCDLSERMLFFALPSESDIS